MGIRNGGGRLPTPTHIHLLKNDKSHQHARKDQASASSDLPKAPDYLNEGEIEIFNDLVKTIAEIYPPSASHVEMIALYAQNKLLSKYLDHQLKCVYKATSYTTEDKLGNVLYKPYPEVQQLAVARKACMDILRDFGLSPSAQRAVKISPPTKKVNAFADLDEAV